MNYEEFNEMNAFSFSNIAIEFFKIIFAPELQSWPVFLLTPHVHGAIIHMITRSLIHVSLPGSFSYKKKISCLINDCC